MAQITAVCMQKGGVGKTTTVINVGAVLAKRGKKVLLVDLDPQGALTVALVGESNVNKLIQEEHPTVYTVLRGQHKIEDAIVRSSNWSLVPATIDLAAAEVTLLNELARERILAEKLTPVAGSYDVVLLDCPPSLGLLTINALTAADNILIPVQTHYLAFIAVRLLLDTIEKVQQRSNPKIKVLGILPTFYNPRATHCREIFEELGAVYGEMVVKHAIRQRIAVADAAMAGTGVVDSDPNSDIAETYRQIVKELYDA